MSVHRLARSLGTNKQTDTHITVIPLMDSNAFYFLSTTEICRWGFCMRIWISDTLFVYWMIEVLKWLCDCFFVTLHMNIVIPVLKYNRIFNNYLSKRCTLSYRILALLYMQFIDIRQYFLYLKQGWQHS